MESDKMKKKQSAGDIKHITTSIFVKEGKHFTKVFVDGVKVSERPTDKSQIRPSSVSYLWHPSLAPHSEVFKEVKYIQGV